MISTPMKKVKDGDLMVNVHEQTSLVDSITRLEGFERIFRFTAFTGVLVLALLGSVLMLMPDEFRQYTLGYFLIAASLISGGIGLIALVASYVVTDLIEKKESQILTFGSTMHLTAIDDETGLIFATAAQSDRLFRSKEGIYYVRRASPASLKNRIDERWRVSGVNITTHLHCDDGATKVAILEILENSDNVA
jgi:hypothetical protein